MDRRSFLGIAAVGVFVRPPAGEAQQPTRVYRIGVVSGQGHDVVKPLLDVFRSGMHDLGYSESELVFHVRLARAQGEGLSRRVGALVNLKVDVILAASSTPARTNPLSRGSLPGFRRDS